MRTRFLDYFELFLTMDSVCLYMEKERDDWYDRSIVDK